MFLRDPHFWIALGLGPLAWIALGATPVLDSAWPPVLPAGGWSQLALVTLAYPVVEELLFRGTIQPAIARRIAMRTPAASGGRPPGLANVLTSLVFAIAHLPFHPAAFALATVFPSLVFGHLRDRHASVVPGTIVHAFYNLGFFTLLVAAR